MRKQGKWACMSSSKKARLSKLLIIGAGLSGYTLVREIRKLDANFPITLITADSGDYYSKPQLSTAFAQHKLPSQLIIMTAEKFATQFNIEIKARTFLECLDFSTPIVLACGAKPAKLPIEKPNVYHVNNLQDYAVFRQALEGKKHVTIVGAGLVGCEFANDLIQSGYRVTMIAPEAYPLSQLVPERVGVRLKEALAERGVCWRLGEFFNPEEPHEIVLSAIGLKPETYLAEVSGIAINKGILVNQYLETSQTGVYALGDCMEYEGKIMPYTSAIALEARALAKTLLGEPTPVHFPPMPVYVKTSLYPIVTLPPETTEGQWEIEEDQGNIRALFYNDQKVLKGFALAGTFTREAVEWSKKIGN